MNMQNIFETNKNKTFLIKFINKNLNQLQSFKLQESEIKDKQRLFFTDLFSYYLDDGFLTSIEKMFVNNEKYNDISNEELEKIKLFFTFLATINISYDFIFFSLNLNGEQASFLRNDYDNFLSDFEEDFFNQYYFSFKTNVEEFLSSNNIPLLGTKVSLFLKENKVEIETFKIKSYFSLLQKEIDSLLLNKDFFVFVEQHFLKENQNENKDIQKTIQKMTSFIKPINKIESEIIDFKNKTLSYFEITDMVFNLYKNTLKDKKDMFFYYEDVLKRKKLDTFDLLLLVLKEKQSKNKNFNIEFLSNNELANLFLIKENLFSHIEFSNNMADLLYLKAKEEYIKLYNKNEKSLPLSLLQAADKGQVFKFHDDFLIENCFVLVNKKPSALIKNDSVSDFLLKKKKKLILNNMEEDYLTERTKNEDLNHFPLFHLNNNPVEDFEYFLNVVSAFYDNLLIKRQNKEILEKEFRVVFMEKFSTILKKIDFYLLKIENENESLNKSIMFEIMEEGEMYYSSSNYRCDNLKIFIENNKVSYFIFYPENKLFEKIQKFSALSLLYNAYVFCYKQGGISQLRISQLIEKTNNRSFNYLDFSNKDIQKFLLPFNLMFIKNILERLI